MPPKPRYCRRCSAPVGPFLEGAKDCGFCRRDRFAFESAFVAYEYRDLVRAAVLRAKGGGGGLAAAWLADQIWPTRGDELSRLDVDVVTSVPQHWTKRVIAPHNAPELIASLLTRRLNLSVHRHILRKVRRTPAQAGLTPSARRANLRSAFRATCRLDGLRVLLVDDVMTTGTTAHRASRALRDAGAAGVWVAAAARGVGS